MNTPNKVARKKKSAVMPAARARVFKRCICFSLGGSFSLLSLVIRLLYNENGPAALPKPQRDVDARKTKRSDKQKPPSFENLEGLLRASPRKNGFVQSKAYFMNSQPIV